MIRRATWLLSGAVRRRGRPPGSKNKPRAITAAPTSTSAASANTSRKTTTRASSSTSSSSRGTHTATTPAAAAAAADKAHENNKGKNTSTSAAKTTRTARDGAGDGALVRPAYMSEAREAEVLKLAERMQVHDLTGDVPVASFALEIIKAHPSVRNMGLRERMDFLCTRWSRLSHKKRLEYLNNPLRGLLPEQTGTSE